MIEMTLYQFPVSHFCEKIRWTLDFKHLQYEARNLAPVFHMPSMMALSRQTQVPVLKLDGQLVVGSAHIIEALEDRFPCAPSLYPKSPEQRLRALELQALWDKELGPHVRRTAYFHAMKNAPFTYALLAEGQNKLNRLLLKGSYPLVVNAMKAGMKINAEGYARSLEKLHAALDQLDAAIQPNGYLVGAQFSVADLSAAALLAPIVRPAKSLYAKPLGNCPEFNNFCESFTKRPFYQWVQDIYRKHR